MPGERSAAAQGSEPPHRAGCLRARGPSSAGAVHLSPQSPPEAPHFLSTTLVEAEVQNEGALSPLTEEPPHSPLAPPCAVWEEFLKPPPCQSSPT